MVKVEDIRKSSTEELNWLKGVIENQIELRKEMEETETVRIIFFDDGCEGSYMTLDDFQECARKKDEYDNDLIDYLEADLNRYKDASITLTVGEYVTEELGNENFLGKENPYYKEDNEEDDE